MIEYSLTPDDVIAFARYHREKLSQQRSSPKQGILATAVLLGMFCTLWLGEAIRGEVWQVILILTGAFVGFALLAWSLTRTAGAIPENRLRQLFQNSEGEKALGERRLTLAADGFTITNPQETTHFAWSQVEDVGITDDYAFLYLADQSHLIVPARAFAHEHQYLEFVEQVREHRHRAA